MLSLPRLLPLTLTEITPHLLPHIHYFPFTNPHSPTHAYRLILIASHLLMLIHPCLPPNTYHFTFTHSSLPPFFNHLMSTCSHCTYYLTCTTLTNLAAFSTSLIFTTFALSILHLLHPTCPLHPPPPCQLLNYVPQIPLPSSPTTFSECQIVVAQLHFSKFECVLLYNCILQMPHHRLACSHLPLSVCCLTIPPYHPMPTTLDLLTHTCSLTLSTTSQSTPRFYCLTLI
jgi:hypothetical protein